MATATLSAPSSPKLVCQFKITKAKIMLARGVPRGSIKFRLRLSQCTIDAIATGRYFCGVRDSIGYYPEKSEWRTFRQKWQVKEAKRKAADEIVNKPRRPRLAPRQEMSKADICNVQLIHTDDMKDVFDSLLDAMAANVVMEEKLFDERWTPVS